MGANKFATMLHRNKTPKIAIILIYTLLEWTLIALLLLNGLFSYLIARFADFFGLKPPCVFCSRVDHVLGGRRNSYEDLICDDHAAEVSRLGYCSNHRKLAEASEMCDDCYSSRPENTDRTVAVLSWMKRSEEGGKDLRCSCCDVVLESGFCSPYLVLKPSFEQKGNFDAEDRSDDHDRLVREIVEEFKEQDERGFVVEEMDACVKEVVDDESLELISTMRGGDELLGADERLVPVELIDSWTAIENQLNSVTYKEDEDRDYSGYNLVEKEDAAVDIGTVSDSSSEEEEEKVLLLSNMEINRSYDLPVPDDDHQCGAPPFIPTLEQELVDVQAEAEHTAEVFVEFQASEEDSKVVDAEANCEISIGSEICDHEHVELPHFDELAIPQSACADEHCAASSNVTIDKEQVTEAGTLEENIARSVNGLSVCTDVNEAEDERMPETPTSFDCLLALHKRFLLSERRELGTDSLDGSVASEIDGNEILTVDHLKDALRAERKALSALYAELEEERSASAVAANQTMAMITRLQEEKAAVQMEALQYQRMMEEQSEYDQEALQLLNELMMKREREKQELERELDVYRKRVLIYEAKERRKAAERSKTNGTSSASSSADDSDDLSFESHEGEYCNYGHTESNLNTPTDDVLSSGADQEATRHLTSLDESLADFEEERLSILEQLKALEEKLFATDEEELKSIVPRHFPEENGHGLNGDYDSYGDNVNGSLVNGFEHDFDTNGKLHQKQRNLPIGGKSLLPLFDAAVWMDSNHGMSPEHETRSSSPRSVSKCAIDDHKRLAIAEEVDNVYERLQALEADREFIKHCIRSLKTGDKGMNLLQEILQHLRDLRNVDLRVRNAGDALSSLST